MFVFDMMADQTVLACSRIGLVIALYVMLSVSLNFPQCVVVSAFMMCIVCLAFSVVFSMCFGSSESPRIFGSCLWVVWCF